MCAVAELIVARSHFSDALRSPRIFSHKLIFAQVSICHHLSLHRWNEKQNSHQYKDSKKCFIYFHLTNSSVEPLLKSLIKRAPRLVGFADSLLSGCFALHKLLCLCLLKNRRKPQISFPSTVEKQYKLTWRIRCHHKLQVVLKNFHLVWYIRACFWRTVERDWDSSCLLSWRMQLRRMQTCWYPYDSEPRLWILPLCKKSPIRWDE